MVELKVVSLNLRGIHDRWWRREPLVVRGLAGLDADVICLQEAAPWCLQARWVAWRLGRATGRKYRVQQARKRGWRGLLEGLATLSRLPLAEHRVLALGPQGRVAQHVVADAQGRNICIANTHLDHRRNSQAIRRLQARSLARWLEARDEPIVLAGDFNDTPESDCLTALEPGFRVCHAGAELRGTAPAWARARVIDYVLVTDKVEVLDAGTCFCEAVGGIWPSDHIGLWARLRI